MRCPKCNAENSDDAEVCIFCSSELVSSVFKEPVPEKIEKKKKIIRNILYGLFIGAIYGTLYIFSIISTAVLLIFIIFLIITNIEIPLKTKKKLSKTKLYLVVASVTLINSILLV